MDKRSPEEHSLLEQLSEPFDERVPWGSPGAEAALADIDAVAVQERRARALEHVQRLPDDLRHAQHVLLPNPFCGVCLAKAST